jgi:hypothetical protein
MLELKTFNYGVHAVRFYGVKPVGTDLAAILGYAEPQKAIDRYVNNHYLEIYNNLILLDDPGIYQLCFSVETLTSTKLLDWIFHTVKPALNNTAVEISRQVKEITDNLGKTHPDLAAFLIDSILSRMDLVLEKKYLTATQIANKLGYDVKDHMRSKLGKHLKEQLGDLGVTRQILVKIQAYPDVEIVHNAVRSFYRT